MKFVEIESIPEKGKHRRARCKNLKHLFDEFMNMNVKFAKFEFNDSEYISARSAYDILGPTAKRLGLPISIHERHGELYFERRDI